MTFYSNRTAIKADISIKDWDVSRAGQTMLFVGRMWTLGLEKQLTTLCGIYRAILVSAWTCAESTVDSSN